MTEKATAAYTEEEARAILNHAIAAEFDSPPTALVSQGELREIAVAAGISDEALQHGEARWKATQREEETEQRRQLGYFVSHLAIFMLISLFFVSLNLRILDRDVWFLITFIGWLGGLGTHALSLRHPSGATAAHRQKHRKQWFFVHVALYVLLNLLLVGLTLASAYRQGQLIFSLSIWAIGIAAHAVVLRTPAKRPMTPRTSSPSSL